MMSTAEIDLAKQIGLFYLQKNKGDYSKTEAELRALQIQAIRLDAYDQCLIIETHRPGRLIGPRGRNIEELTIHLSRPIKIIETKECVYDYMIPVDEKDSLPWVDE